MKKIRCSSCFALTGTLVQNRMDEMWSVLDFVSGKKRDFQLTLCRCSEARRVH